jgi:hypothetical protein
VQQSLRARGVVFLGLTDEDASTLTKSEAFVDEVGMTWPNGYGAAETIASLRVSGLPTVFVIGSDGRVLWHDEMDGVVEDALEAALWLRDHPQETAPFRDRGGRSP